MVKTSVKPNKIKKRSVINSDQCNICFENIKIYKGSLDCHEKNCKSQFCFECIKKWTQKQNTCPCCLAKIKKIKKVDIKSNTVTKEVSVEDKRQSSQPSDIPNVYFMVHLIGRILERSRFRMEGIDEDGNRVTLLRVDSE